MTIGRDLDWLADDEGNLHPEVSREIMHAATPDAGQPPHPPPAPPAPRQAEAPRPGQVARPDPAPPPERHAEARPQVQVVERQVPVLLPVARPRPALHWLGVVAAAAGLTGLLIGRWLPVPASPTSGVSSNTESPLLTAPMALVSGVNVNLRTGPGLGYPVVARLLPGEGLRIGQEREGWCAVTTNTGVSGYVFAAFLRGLRLPDRGAAQVVRPLTSNGEPRIVLRPGDKVFYVREPSGSTLVLLPTGRRLWVSNDDLAPLD